MSSNTPPLLSKDELFQWVMRRLGEPVRSVRTEIFCENLEDALRDALAWWTAKKGLRKEKFVQIIANQNSYDLEDEIALVLDVNFSANPYDFSYLYTPYIFPDQQIPYNTYAAPKSMGVYSTFVQNIAYIEQAKKILGAEPHWEQVNRKLYIYPIPTSGFNNTALGNMLLTYKSTDVVLDKLPARDHDLVKRYVLAFIKRDLGTIRDRFGIYPGAQTQVPSDGKRLLQEAEVEFAKLEQEIEMSGYPMASFFG